VTEIPEHLLQRTQSRRQALGLPTSGGGDGGAGDGGAAGGGGAVATTGGGTPAVPDANLPKGPVAPSGPVERSTPAPAPAPHYVQAYERRKKVPVWALPALIGLPFWALFYAGTLEPPPSTELTLLEEGAEVYTANCSSCHGAGGGGGVGPVLSAGSVLETFADPTDQVRWVVVGSEGATGGVYGDTAKASKGGMPAFGTAGTLTLEEIVAAVRHERETLSGEEFDEETAAEWGGLMALVEDPELEGLYTEEEVTELLTLMSEQTGVEVPLPE
jgi:mono/diheme cytochrome c family protein